MMDELFDDDNNNYEDGNLVAGRVASQNSLRTRVEKSGSGVCMVFADEATLKSSFASALQ